MRKFWDFFKMNPVVQEVMTETYMEIRVLRYFLTAAKEQILQKWQNSYTLHSQPCSDSLLHLRRNWASVCPQGNIYR